LDKLPTAKARHIIMNEELLESLFTASVKFHTSNAKSVDDFHFKLKDSIYVFEETKEGHVLDEIHKRINALTQNKDSKVIAINYTIKKLEMVLCPMVSSIDRQEPTRKDGLIIDLYDKATKPFNEKDDDEFRTLLESFYRLYNLPDITHDNLRTMLDEIRLRLNNDIKAYKKSASELNAYVNNIRFIYERYTTDTRTEI